MTRDAGEPGPGTVEDDVTPGTVAESLAGLDDLPLEEHVARFGAVHDRLRARLDGQDEQVGAPGAET